MIFAQNFDGGKVLGIAAPRKVIAMRLDPGATARSMPAVSPRGLPLKPAASFCASFPRRQFAGLVVSIVFDRLRGMQHTVEAFGPVHAR